MNELEGCRSAVEPDYLSLLNESRGSAPDALFCVKGHLPRIGEWVALPLMAVAGSQTVGDRVYQNFAYPVAVRMLAMVDAVYRIEGASTGADEDVRLATVRGIPVYTDIAEIPEAYQ